MASLAELIRGLKAELHTLRRFQRTLRTIDLPGLRRDVAFYCHPDRGGDGNVMRRVNLLFDSLMDTGS